MDYTTMPLMTQLETIQADVGAVGTLKQMAEMWGQAATTLSEASGDFQAATNQLEPNWTDDSGVDFVTNARESDKTIDTWAQNIANSQAQNKIEQVAGEIPGTAQAVQQVVDQYNEMLPLAVSLGMTPEQLELMFRPLAGAAMNKLAGTYGEATAAVSKARGGNWQGLAGDHPGASAVSGESARTVDLAMTQQGDFSTDGAGGVDGAGVDGVEGVDGSGGVGADSAGVSSVSVPDPVPAPDDSSVIGDPSLSGGLGAAPVAPPSAPPVVPPPMAPAAPPVPAGGMPMAPGMSALGGRGFFGGGGGGPRVPGVRLGGPVGAQPVNSAAAPTPASAPTVAQLTAATPSSGTTSGVPPMVPPMAGGMGGFGGGGGIPGPGVGRRKYRDDGDPPTPGLPAILSGKAGLPDAFRYTSANRAEDSDAPGTVQIVDEDLWHDEAPFAPLVSGR